MAITEQDFVRVRQAIQKLKAGITGGQQVFTTYHDSNYGATPSNPTGDGTAGSWHWLPTSESRWFSTKTALKVTGGTWSNPTRVFGLTTETMDGAGTSADVPILRGIVFLGDTGTGKVGWHGGTIDYDGTQYAIASKAAASGSTDEFIYWDDADGQTSFKTTDTLATAIGANHHYVCENKSGVATPALVEKIILGGLIQANTITAGAIDVTDLAAISADLGTVTAGSISAALIKVGTLLADRITSTSLTGCKTNTPTIWQHDILVKDDEAISVSTQDTWELWYRESAEARLNASQQAKFGCLRLSKHDGLDNTYWIRPVVWKRAGGAGGTRTTAWTGAAIWISDTQAAKPISYNWSYVTVADEGIGPSDYFEVGYEIKVPIAVATNGTGQVWAQTKKWEDLSLDK